MRHRFPLNVFVSTMFIIPTVLLTHCVSVCMAMMLKPLQTTLPTHQIVWTSANDIRRPSNDLVCSFKDDYCAHILAMHRKREREQETEGERATQWVSEEWKPSFTCIDRQFATWPKWFDTGFAAQRYFWQNLLNFDIKMITATRLLVCMYIL